MSDKALITPPSVESPIDAATERSRLADFGLHSESRAGRGFLVKLRDRNQTAEIEALGYSVKYLRDTNLLKVGDYVVDVDEDPAKVRPALPPELTIFDPFAEGWFHYLVQLDVPPTEHEITVMQKRGIKVVEPISVYGLFVVGSDDDVKKLAELPFVVWTGPFEPAYRVPRRLLELTGLIRYLSIGIYSEDQVSRVVEVLKSVRAKIVGSARPSEGFSEDYWKLLVEVKASELVRLARLPGVRWLEFASAFPSLDGEREAQIVAGNVNGSNIPIPGYQNWLAAKNLSGNDIVIAICDTGVSDNVNDTRGGGHDDLRGRQRGFRDYTGSRGAVLDTDGHGTHVASITLGDARESKKDSTPADPAVRCGQDNGAGDHFLCGQGIAPKAGYYSQNPLAAWPQILNTLILDAATAGAHIMNNSWGDEGLLDGPSGPRISSGYTPNCRDLDWAVRDPKGTGTDLDSLLVVFSAGNEGPRAGTISTPHEAKNIIVVGSSLTYLRGIGDGLTPDNINGIHGISSRGPAADGRILPNVVAPGNNVTGASIAAVNSYVRTLSGTSLAAAVVSGACALVIEWWLKNVSKNRPSPAMMKAILISGAVDLFGGPDGDLPNPNSVAHIPNHVQGWGRINVANMIKNDRLFFDQDHPLTATGQKLVLRVRPRSTDPLRITLAWTDAPGSVGGQRALVNDLDLKVTDAAGNLFRGNVFDPLTGFSRTGGEPDTINNIECVYIQRPNGVYEITVSAESLKQRARPPFDLAPWQDFALVVSNAEEVA